MSKKSKLNNTGQLQTDPLVGLPHTTVTVQTRKGDREYKITCSKDVNEIFHLLLPNEEVIWREHFFLLCLNRANKVFGWYRISSGGTAGTVVDIKIILQIALGCNAHGIILGHNHPSGNAKPSQADINITKKCKDAVKLLDIDLLDHLIFTEKDFYSFADEGNL